MLEPPSAEPDDGLFEGVGLVYSFGFGVALVDRHKGAPEFGEGAGKADVFSFALVGDGVASVDAGKWASSQIIGEGVDLSVFPDNGSLAGLPPFKIDSERGIAQAGCAGVGEVVPER